MQVFLSCVSEKASSRCKAKDMYISDLFKKSYEYAKSLNPDKIYILSAKYHLLNLNKEIEPYNLTLKDMGVEKRKKWADEVIKEMKDAHIDFDAKTYFFAGEDYIEFLRDYFPNKVEIYKGKPIGEILHWLSMKMNKANECLISLKDYLMESIDKEEASK